MSIIVKNLLVTFLLLVTLLGNAPTIALAQEASDSASVSPSPESTPTPVPFTEDDQNVSTTPQNQNPSDSENANSNQNSLDELDAYDSLKDGTLIPNLNASDSKSATIRYPVRVQKLRKSTFKANEKITIVVENAQASELTINMFNADGVEVPINLEKVSDSDPVVMKIVPHNQFRAGKYRLKIVDGEGNVTTQDFTWGVLAINPNKSIYMPQEISKMAIAVLDEVGLMVCDAKVTLHMTSSEANRDDILSTENGKIKVNPECQIKDYTEKPDYETEYPLGGIGTYEMQLTAETKNGTYSITDTFEVRTDMSFDVERNTATRIFPPVEYPATFTITAHEDFEGSVTDIVPGNFAVSELEGVAKYENVVVNSSEEIIDDQLEASIFDMGLPFEHEQAISLGFGEQLRDPVQGKRYTDFGLIGHDGIDFDLPVGTAVLAVDEGEIIKAAENDAYGTTAVIQHSWGRSYYGHLSQITHNVGDKVRKGQPFALSGSTGLSSGPHLHFGIKPNKHDMHNGYYGKINPLPFLKKDHLENPDEHKSIVVADSVENVQVVTWNISVKKGETIKLGYKYKVPNISPQFYLLGPLEFKNKDGETVFQESRQWQLAIDADGSGTNVVSPSTGNTSDTAQTYTFTFTSTEAMTSGGVSITVPAGWSAPQTSNSSAAGYTTLSTASGIVATVLTSSDAETGWTEDDSDTCNTTTTYATDGWGLDTTTKTEGTGSIQCDNVGSALPDASDSMGFDFTAQNWSNYTTLAAWVRLGKATDATNYIQLAYDDTNTLASPLGSQNLTALSANTWTFVTHTLSVARTAVTTAGIVCQGAGCDSTQLWIDEIMVGGTASGAVAPTITGTGPWDIGYRLINLDNTETAVLVYGSGGGAGGVTNSSSAGVHTFTTKSRTTSAGTLTNISAHPTVTLTTSGPTNDQLMRHGKWFNSGVKAAFTF
jgi:murein DD-endopeptidase MepM/ murein hydrolase activator NlpD